MLDTSTPKQMIVLVYSPAFKLLHSGIAYVLNQHPTEQSSYSYFARYEYDLWDTIFKRPMVITKYRQGGANSVVISLYQVEDDQVLLWRVTGTQP